MRDAHPPACARHGEHLQRAADHERVGGRGIQGGEGRGPRHRLRLERQRHAAGARVPPAVGRPLQGRSEELRRPPLSANWAGGCNRFSTRSDACTRWASGSRSSRCSSPASTTAATRSSGSTSFIARRLARHSVARHRVPRRLQDDRPAEHDRRDAAGRSRHRQGERPAARLRGQPAGQGRGPREHALRGVWRGCSSPAMATRIREYRLTADGRCPSCAAPVPGRWGAGFDGQVASRPFVPGSRRLTILNP